MSFLAELPLDQQAEWLMRLRWLRVADRLAENEILEPARGRFTRFRSEWQALCADQHVGGVHTAIWHEMRAAWFHSSINGRELRAVEAWNEYLKALGDYTPSSVRLHTLEDHDRMLLRLAGSFFGVFPHLLDPQREAAARFGMLDQLMNNLRDLAEDAAQGICYFPSDVLARFAVSRSSVISGDAIGTSRFEAMMRFWLDEYLAQTRAGAACFTILDDLHPSLAKMRAACIARYARVEQVLRSCGFDYMAFPEAYWRAVRTELCAA